MFCHQGHNDKATSFLYIVVVFLLVLKIGHEHYLDNSSSHNHEKLYQHIHIDQFRQCTQLQQW
jgi:hypothetical protein